MLKNLLVAEKKGFRFFFVSHVNKMAGTTPPNKEDTLAPALVRYSLYAVVIYATYKILSGITLPTGDYIPNSKEEIAKKVDTVVKELDDLDDDGDIKDEFLAAAGITTDDSTAPTPPSPPPPPTEEEKNAICMADNTVRLAKEDGTCDEGFELDKNGCCALPKKKENVGDMANDLMTVAGPEIAAFVATDALPKLIVMLGDDTGKAGSKALAKSMSGKAMQKLQAKFAARFAKNQIGKKLVSKIAGNFAAKLAAKFALKMAQAMVKMSSPLIIFDIFSLALDMADPAGYNTFINNSVIDEARDASEIETANQAKKMNMDYPMIFPLNTAFPDAYEKFVAPAMQEAFLSDAVARLTEEDRVLLMEALIDEEDVPDSVATKIGMYIEEEIANNPQKRDDTVWKALTSKASGVDTKLIARYPKHSTKTRLGVSLSKEGTKWWNGLKKNRDEWFKYNDLFQKMPDMPEDYAAPPVAVWGKKYRALHPSNPGTDKKPNMITVDVKEGDMPMYLPAGHIVAFCEKERDALFMGGLMGNVQDANDGVDPKKFGVRFDNGTGDLGQLSCIYTDAYCTRMGLKHRVNIPKGISDCWKDGGQDVGEAIFGTTITRGIYRGAHALFGFTCHPDCNITEYCEGRKCHKKKKVGQGVGITAGWKCLTGFEDWGKCAECKKGKDCDEIEKTEKGKNCKEKGTCYCEFGACEYKKTVGQHVGFTAGWKCLSNLEAFAKCVECKGPFGQGNGHCDKLYPKGTKYCEGDKCHDKKGLGSNVGWTAGWKCKSGKEINGRCHDGERSLPKGTDVGWNNGKYCKPHGRGSKMRANGTYDTSANSGTRGAEEGGKCMGECKGLASNVGWNRGKFCCSGKEINGRCHNGNGSLPYGTDVAFNNGKYCKSGMEDMGKCCECKKHNHCNMHKSVSGHDCRNGKCYCEWGKCHLKKSRGQHVGLTAGWKCLSGLEAFAKCVECKGPFGQGNHHCDRIYPKGTKYCEGDRCHQKKGNGSNVGWTAKWKCQSGKEINGRCHDGDRSLPAGTDVAWNNGKYCMPYGRGSKMRANGTYDTSASSGTWGAEEGGKCMGACKGNASNVGWNRGKFCCSGKEINGRCHNGNGSLPAGTDVGWNNGKYCAPNGRTRGGREEGGKCLGKCIGRGGKTSMGRGGSKKCCSDKSTFHFWQGKVTCN